MTISVVMSTYNGAKYIIEQLDSIRNQTMQPSEVLISDDCSTDNTYSIIKKYIHQNQLVNWKLFSNQENFGWRKSFSLLIEKTKGDIIFLSDQDDIWKLDKIEIMSTAMTMTSGCSILVSNFKEFNYSEWEEDTEKDSLKIKQIETTPKWSYIQRPGCVFCFKKEIAMIYGKIWCETYAHDVLLWHIGMALNCIYSINYKAIYFRRHNHNATPENEHDRKTKITFLKSSLRNYESLTKIIKDYDLQIKTAKLINTYGQFLHIRYDLLMNHRLKDIVWLICHLNYYSKGLLSLGVDIKCMY